MHRWVEHTAEQELHVEAASPEEVFTEAAEALASLLGEPGPGPPVRREIELSAPDRPALLADWLNELIYLADGGFLPERVLALELPPASGENEDRSHRLTATVEGREGTPRSLVKAVTYHRLRFEPEGVRWYGRVVLDV